MRIEEKEFLEANFAALRAEMKASTDVLGYKIDELKQKQDIANHRTYKLEKKTAFIDFISKNKVASVLIFLVLLFGMSLLSNNIDIHKMIEKNTPIELRHEKDNS